MKPAILVAVILGATGNIYGQGQLVFDNFSGGVDARITNAPGWFPMFPTNGAYVADLFYFVGTTTDANSLTNVGGFNKPFSPGRGGGYSAGGARTFPLASYITCQVRSWFYDGGRYPTYDSARLASVPFGFSNLVGVVPDVPPGAPRLMFGLKGYQMQVIPEPSVFVLAILGGAGMVLDRGGRRFRQRARLAARTQKAEPLQQLGDWLLRPLLSRLDRDLGGQSMNDLAIKESV